MRPTRVLPINRHADYVRAEQQWQQGTRGLARRQGVRKQPDRQNTQPRHTRLRKSDEKRADGKKSPLPRGQIHAGASCCEGNALATCKVGGGYGLKSIQPL